MTQKASEQKTLADLETNDCRWPIGDPRHEGFHFCGEQQAAGRPYCAAHWGLSFIPSKSRHAAGTAHRIVAPTAVPQIKHAA